MVKYTPNHFPIAAQTRWEDGLAKVDEEFKRKTVAFIQDQYLAAPPTFYLKDRTFLPGSIAQTVSAIANETNMGVCDIYLSVGANGNTFGRHKDSMDVLIVQGIGQMLYTFDEHAPILMNPGDSLFIPTGVYHCPVTLGPRLTYSMSWV